MGDWKARVGEDIEQGLGCIREHGETTLNKNGRKLLNFCQTNAPLETANSRLIYLCGRRGECEETHCTYI